MYLYCVGMKEMVKENVQDTHVDVCNGSGSVVHRADRRSDESQLLDADMSLAFQLLSTSSDDARTLLEMVTSLCTSGKQKLDTSPLGGQGM